MVICNPLQLWVGFNETDCELQKSFLLRISQFLGIGYSLLIEIGFF
jgi:hypothetical protein